MAITVRKTRGRKELDVQWQMLASLSLLLRHWSNAVIDAGASGCLSLSADVKYRDSIGVERTKAATTDFWNLSAETDTGVGEYRAYWLYISHVGTAVFRAGDVATDAAGALAALPAADDGIYGNYTVLGVLIVPPETDMSAVSFDEADASPLAAMNSGIPEGVPIGVPGKTYIRTPSVTLVGS